MKLKSFAQFSSVISISAQLEHSRKISTAKASEPNGNYYREAVYAVACDTALAPSPIYSKTASLSEKSSITARTIAGILSPLSAASCLTLFN